MELANKSYSSGIYLFTDFLGLPEQSVFDSLLPEIRGIPYTAFGGAVGTERIMIRFGSEELSGYTEDFPIVCIKAEPRSEKFAEPLSHRDYLGALMNLGIERSTLGDIAIVGCAAYIFAKESIAPYIVSSLSRVRHTDVKLSLTDEVPTGELYKTERRRIQAVGERLDAVIAKVYSISREDSLSLFRRGLVFASGRELSNNSYIPKVGEIISVRGFGRFVYLGYSSTSKKGKLNIDIDVYV